MQNMRLFGKTKEIEAQICEYLDTLVEGNLNFRAAVGLYLDAGPQSEQFGTKIKQLTDQEHNGDRLRRQIEATLYTNALIPDFRGDVLSLMEDLDSLLSIMKHNLMSMSVEQPQFPGDLSSDLKNLTEQVTASVDSCVVATRSFFRDINSVRDSLQKVSYFEKEADQVAGRLKTAIFGSSMGLDHKTHLRHFVDMIDQLADEAEDVADWLAIYTIKRMD